MAKYREEHYEDVARILRDAIDIASECNRSDCGCKVESPAIARASATLSAADNPPVCQCGATIGTMSLFNTDHGGHVIKGGFDRERFLAACGIKA